MKKLINSFICGLFLCMFSSFVFASDKCRIYYKPDGTISVIHPADNSQRADESELDWLKRVYEDSEIHKQGFLFEDTLVVLLPDRNTRDKWRGSKATGIIIDNDIITKKERLQSVENQIDVELAKQSPDVLKVLKLKRKIDKKDY